MYASIMAHLRKKANVSFDSFGNEFNMVFPTEM